VGALDRFAAAFNERDLDALAACVAEDATARVDGAPFPEEKGRDEIRATSLRYLLEDEDLRAVRHGAIDGWILLQDVEKRLDTAIECATSGGAVTALRYVTAPHRPGELHRVAQLAGMRVPD